MFPPLSTRPNTGSRVFQSSWCDKASDVIFTQDGTTIILGGDFYSKIRCTRLCRGPLHDSSQYLRLPPSRRGENPNGIQLLLSWCKYVGLREVETLTGGGGCLKSTTMGCVHTCFFRLWLWIAGLWCLCNEKNGHQKSKQIRSHLVSCFSRVVKAVQMVMLRAFGRSRVSWKSQIPCC